MPTALIGRSGLPLVVSLHGGGSDARGQDMFTRMRLKAAEAGFVLLTPDGYRGTWNAGSCCAPATTAGIDHSAVDRDLDTTPPTQVFTCQPTRPVPVLHLHGLADACVPFNGGPSTGPAGGERPPVSDSIDFWVTNNRCALPPVLPTQVNGEARCDRYTVCQDQATVELCTLEGAGHVWPGTGANPSAGTCGGSGTTDLDANAVIWAFFEDHPLR